jgi:hypothetical protein
MNYCIIIPLIIFAVNILVLHFMIRNVELKEKNKNDENDNI